MRLNIGCGGRKLDGYVGVDAVARPAADYIAPADRLPFEAGSCEEVMAIHLFEHLLPWDAPKALLEWFRVLRPGGKLVLEIPDLEKCCRNVLTILAGGRVMAGKHPGQAGMWGLYGDERLQDEFMLHRWGYTFQTIHPLLEAAGFTKITEHPTQFHPIGRHVRDFRVEAIKP